MAMRIEAGRLNRQRLAPLAEPLSKNQIFLSFSLTMSSIEPALGVVGAMAAVDVAIK